VFSDEFETDGRQFGDGFDPRWTALEKNDYTNSALQYYKAQNVNTSGGLLHIYTEKKVNFYRAFNETTKKYYSDKKDYQSGMVQGWNKFCITGGIVEISAKLPGHVFSAGLWPASKYAHVTLLTFELYTIDSFCLHCTFGLSFQNAGPIIVLRIPCIIIFIFCYQFV